MRVIFEIARLFAIVAVFGLMAASSGCAKPEDSGSSAPTSSLGDEGGDDAEAGSVLGGGAEIPGSGDEGEDDGDVPVAGDDDAPAETEAPAEGDAPAETEAPAEDGAPAEGKAAAEGEAPAEGKAAAKPE